MKKVEHTPDAKTQSPQRIKHMAMVIQCFLNSKPEVLSEVFIECLSFSSKHAGQYPAADGMEAFFAGCSGVADGGFVERHDPSTRLIAVNHETDCAQPVNIAAIVSVLRLRCDDDRSDRLSGAEFVMMTGPRSGLPFARGNRIVSGEVMGNQLMLSDEPHMRVSRKPRLESLA